MASSVSITFPSASTLSRRRLPPLSAMCNRTSPSTLTRHCRLTSSSWWARRLIPSRSPRLPRRSIRLTRYWAGPLSSPRSSVCRWSIAMHTPNFLSRLASWPIAARVLSCQAVMSGPVAGVDPYVAFGQVAGPESRFAFSLASNRQPDFTIRGIELGLQFLLGEWRREAAPAHGHSLHVDIGFRRIEDDARIAGGRKDTAPVRIGARDRRLHQRRIGDGARHTRRPVTVRGPGDHDG